jgi:hypothetical protein
MIKKPDLKKDLLHPLMKEGRRASVFFDQMLLRIEEYETPRV